MFYLAANEDCVTVAEYVDALYTSAGMTRNGAGRREAIGGFGTGGSGSPQCRSAAHGGRESVEPRVDAQHG
jgi:hypothetical protein